MSIERINSAILLPALVLLGVAGAPAWAATPACGQAARAEGSGIGGTGIDGTGIAAEGSGIGGTGIVAEGSGIGGTGAPAGRVIFSHGTAAAEGAGGSRPLVKGAPVCVGETIVTAQSASVQIRMADGGMLSIRPETKVKIDEFRFDGKEDGSERSVITLLQGGFRALTGLIGHTHKENYSIRTPYANIGIRGTDHEPMFIPDPAPGQSVTGQQPGTYDKVNSGGVVIRNAQGAVEVRPDQVGFVPNDAATSPMLLKEMPAFYSAGHDRAHEGAREPAAGSEAGEHGRGKERGEHGEIHVPGPTPGEERTPEVAVPEIRTPETPEASGADD